MISAVPAVTIMKDLVLAGFSFELYEEDRLDLGSLTGGGPCVDRVNGHALRKKVELTHGQKKWDRLARKVRKGRRGCFDRLDTGVILPDARLSGDIRSTTRFDDGPA